MKLFISAVLLFIVTTGIFAQSPKSPHPPINWQLMDWQKDGYPGISLEKAYNELLINKKPLKKIIVAIIDDGLDDKHPDLAGMEWTNTKEIPGNNIDDDKNGFIDDVHGWNFIGNQRDETFEEIREYIRLKDQFENKSDTAAVKKNPQYDYWKKIVTGKDKKISSWKEINQLRVMFLTQVQTLQSYWSKKLGNDTVYIKDVIDHQPDPGVDSSVIQARNFLIGIIKGAHGNEDSIILISAIEEVKMLMNENNYVLQTAKTVIDNNDPAYFRKKELGDDPYINIKRNYGNPNTFPDGSHGTECAGIIAALRNNNIGMNGITNSVEIMPIRIQANENSSGWDKDVANAIRYAVDNGAQLINMSFSNYFSSQKNWVDAAVKYAEQKGVLLINSAGNDASNNDSLINYPQPFYSDKLKAPNFIKVGASTYDSSLVGWFSNYGASSVDVFAPAVDIYSTQLNGKYDFGWGTSFAAPMVVGLAALIWSYYPQFSYKQIKYCIEESAKPIDIMVTKPGTDEKVPFRTLSRTGGIINAYQALLIAEKIAKKK